jgi:hypothetical protein
MCLRNSRFSIVFAAFNMLTDSASEVDFGEYLIFPRGNW